jgi:hypothetical protein
MPKTKKGNTHSESAKKKNANRELASKGNGKKENPGEELPPTQSSEGIMITILVIMVVVILALVGGLLYKNGVFSKKVVYTQPLDEQNQIVLNKLNETDRYEYGGLAFIKEQGFWTTTAHIGNGDFDILLHYGPREVQDINITYWLNNFSLYLYQYKEAYITFDPTETNASSTAVAAGTLARSLTDVYHVHPIGACTNSSDICKERPILVCESRPDRAIIRLVPHGKTSIVYSKNCLTITGEGTELIRAADKARLGWYGIVK